MSDDNELSRFEYNFIVAVISDTSFRNYVIEIIDPEFILDLDYRYIYKTVIKMVKRNHPVIFMSVVETLRLDTALSEQKLTYYEEVLIPLSSTEMKLIVDSSLAYVMPRVEAEVSRSVVNRALSRGINLSEEGKYQDVFKLFRDLEAQSLFQKAKKKDFLGEEKELDFEMGEVREEINKKGIPLGINGTLESGEFYRLDKDLFYEGLLRGQMAIAACETKLGKTTLLLNIGIFQTFHGENVDFYSLETGVKYLKLRGYSVISGIATNDLKNNLDEALGKMKGAYKRYPDRGRMTFYRYPPGKLTAAMIASNIAQDLKRGRKVTSVIIDYVDLMAVQHAREDDTAKIKRLNTELGAIAIEHDFALTTASQVGRQAFGKKNVGAGDVAGSISKIFGCDVFLLMYQEEEIIRHPSGEEQTKILVKIRLDRTRYGKMGKAILLEANKDTGRMFSVFP